MVNFPTHPFEVIVAPLLAVVVAKCLEQQSHNLEVPSLNPPAARAFFFTINAIVSLIRSLFAVTPIITLAGLPEAKQA